MFISAKNLLQPQSEIIMALLWNRAGSALLCSVWGFLFLQSLVPAAVTALCLVSNSAWPGPRSGGHGRWE